MFLGRHPHSVDCRSFDDQGNNAKVYPTMRSQWVDMPEYAKATADPVETKRTPASSRHKKSTCATLTAPLVVERRFTALVATTSNIERHDHANAKMRRESPQVLFTWKTLGYDDGASFGSF